jgi:peroxiredoxin
MRRINKQLIKAIPLIIMVSTTVLSLNGQTDTTTLTRIGDIAPSFKCKTLDGKTLVISNLKGKVILLNFFATWCPPCNLELPVLQKKIWEKYRNNPDFVLIILGREHTESEVRDFAGKKNFSMPFAADPKREIFSLYATQNIPRNVIIGKDGKIIFQATGYSEEEFAKIEKQIAEELSR